MNAEAWAQTLTPFAVLIVIVMQKVQSKKVKTALETQSDAVKGALEDAAVKSNDKLDAIHGMVNGAMVEQKRRAMLQAERIAELTKDPSDEALARDARLTYRQMVDRQQRVGTAIGLAVANEHRIVLTDGPMMTIINDRLTTILPILVIKWFARRYWELAKYFIRVCRSAGL